jgi:hypothetical protein
VLGGRASVEGFGLSVFLEPSVFSHGNDLGLDMTGGARAKNGHHAREEGVNSTRRKKLRVWLDSCNSWR